MTENDDTNTNADDEQRAPLTDVRKNINESAHPIRLKTKIKRGEDTRDQDEVEVKVRGDDPEETAQTLHDTVTAIREHGTVNALRGTQPSVEEDADE